MVGTVPCNLVSSLREEVHVGNNIGGVLASAILGVAIASATVFGLVSSQTAPPAESPGSVTQPSIPYGSN